MEMFIGRTHRVTDRIVSLHQPYVRLIVRRKEQANDEFGSKISVSLVNGYSFIDRLAWDAYNEASYLMESIKKYKKRHGYFPLCYVWRLIGFNVHVKTEKSKSPGN